MKLAVIVQDGVTQISFEPESDWEQSTLDQIRKHTGKVTQLSGEVFKCQGGWTRFELYASAAYSHRASLILRLEPADPQPAPVLP